MDGAGTDDSELIRLVVTHYNNDMNEIKEVFRSKYNMSLKEMIEVSYFNVTIFNSTKKVLCKNSK